MLQWLLIGLGVAFVLEGVCYAAAPQAMKRITEEASRTDPARLRLIGLAAVAAGVALVALVTGTG